MSPKEFFLTVEKMREHQRAYFRSKGKDRIALQSAKHYEQMIDTEIKRVNVLLKEELSPRLDFKEPDH